MLYLYKNYHEPLCSITILFFERIQIDILLEKLLGIPLCPSTDKYKYNKFNNKTNQAQNPLIIFLSKDCTRTKHTLIHPSNQPSNHQSNQPTTIQSTIQQTIQTLIQPANKPTNQPINYPTNHPIINPTSQLIRQPIY